ncbi:MAG TPA: ATPase [Cyanobacteria bacterium UBA11372]|nr:ATPase [Cyanobacteria bacterium UBA11372]
MLQEETRRIEFRADIDSALTQLDTLPEILKRCTAAVVEHLDAAFARIWTLNAKENVLELQASSGLYTHINGSHSRIPVSKFKIGWIAQTCQPHLTNDVYNDERISDRDWARREGMISFAGYPLIVEGQLVGVIALFARHALNDSVLKVLELVSHEIALGIKRKQVEEALQKSEMQLRQKAQHLEETLHQLQQTQLQMIQSEKMSALGNLVAGVAHEINNPVGFISGNISEAMATVGDLINHLRLYQEKFDNPGEEIEKDALDIDLEYLLEDLPKMLSSMKVGCDRIRNISTSLRTFSRADRTSKVSANLHEGLDTTLMILQYRLKAKETRPAIQVIKEYAEIPSVKCYFGQLNQVFMNIISNAIDALEESNQGRSYAAIEKHPNMISIKTEIAEDRQSVLIKIKDNGLGMTKEVKSRIFDHLFTTKAVGKGTGLGLSISRQIVQETHGGSLTCSSALGEGAEFAIMLPLDRS